MAVPITLVTLDVLCYRLAMYTYREQLETLNALRLKAGESRRVGCPFCGGNKTFTVSSVDGSLLWHCYKASCGVRGKKGVGRNPDQIRAKLQSQTLAQSRRSQPIPSLVSDPKHHPSVIRYLEQNGSLDAYEQRWIEIVYTPAEDRVLFYNHEKVGAAGRSLSGQKPKWKVYGDTTSILTVGTGSTIVLVEDAASACSVARLDGFVGGALLGTNLSPHQKSQLRSYERIIIALDKDASKQALLMQAKIQGLRPCAVRFLSDDLKYLSPVEIRSIL